MLIAQSRYSQECFLFLLNPLLSFFLNIHTELPPIRIFPASDWLFGFFHTPHWLVEFNQFLGYKLKIKLILRLTKRGDLALISRDVHNSKVFSSDLLNLYNHYRKMSRYQSGEWWYCDWTGCIRISTLAANQYHFIATLIFFSVCTPKYLK